jgi:hypothetical protein
MTDEIVSSQIYKSRDQIRNQLIVLLKQYLELENVDLTKSSFLSFIVDTLSTLTSNTLFYQISAYREFFLTKAQLPESIYNLAAFLGYSPEEATPAQVSILFTIPFGFEDAITIFQIPDKFTVTAEGSIEFASYYTTTITVTNNSQVQIVVQEGNRTYNLPVTIEDSDFVFILPFRQYSTSQQEFAISDDLQQYQFVSIDVPFSGQISAQTVQVRPSGSASYETYTEYASLFLMDSSTKGYVVRRTDSGINLQFGNGLIGYQPQAGSTILVTLSLTNGADGNVITGSIKSGDRIYNTTDAGITEIVQYTITNAAPAVNGEDEESIEQIRSNAIINISALQRIVSENDFINADVIIDDSPIGANSLPVLKRSDLKVNEIALYSTIYFGDDLAPTRDVFETFSTTSIPRQTVINFDGVDYYTLFDMTIDELNSNAEYTYIMYEIEQIPTLVTSYASDYDLYADQLTVTRSGATATYTLDYKTTESDSSLTTCKMEISSTGATYNMTNDGTAFVVYFLNNLAIPKGELTYFFTISHPSEGNIAQYSTQFIFRQDLSDFTMSNVVSDGTSYTVYDIPTVKKAYYDTINQRDFEVQVMQQLLTTLTFKDYRMLTDFINFKFSNTTGILRNMQLNDVDLVAVTSIRCGAPFLPVVGDRYIVGRGSTGDWEDYDDDIATYTSDGTSYIWVFTEPKSQQMVYITNEDYKYIYSDLGWVKPEYEIPLQISIDVFRESTYTGSLGALTQDIRATLLTAFEDRFGINAEIYRSEIIDVVQGVDGVDHCSLLTPESSIFFNFDINYFTQTELLEYAPEYVYFTEDDITIRIF